MTRRFLSTGGLLLLAAMASCASPLHDESWRPARPLGAERAAYRPPVDPASARVDAPVAEPAGDLTLAHAVALALLHNPGLETFAWDVRIAEAHAIQASLPPNPVLGVMVENIAGSGELAGVDNAMTTISIGQLIELAGKRAKRTEVAERTAALAGWDYEVTRLEVLVETTRRFISVLADQRRVDLAGQMLTIAEDVHKIVSDRVRGGVAPTADRDRAAVRLSQERIALQRAQRMLENSRHQLAAIWDGREPRFDRVVGDLSVIDARPELESVLPLLAQNPGVARWDDEVAQREAGIRSERAAGVPDVMVGPGIRYMSDIEEHALMIEVSMPLPLFDRNQGGVLAARYALAKANAERRDAHRRAREQLAEAVSQMHAARREVQLLRSETLPAATAAFDASKRAFREGATDYTTVLDTERTFIDAQRQEVEALAEYQHTLNRIEGLTGQPIKPAADDR